MNKTSLIWGTFCLLLANVLSRALGFVYRIFLVRMIGSEGIGLTEMVSPIYSFCLVAASVGLPLAMSRLIAEELGRRKYDNLERIWRLTLRSVSIWSAIVSLLVFILAPWLIGNFASDERILTAFRAITPAIFIVSVCSCYRGYFQATKQIATIGFSQNIEQITRVILGLGLSYWLIPYGLKTVIVGLSIATVLGELCGLVCIVYRQKRQKSLKTSKPTLSRRVIGKYLLMVGIPLTGQRLLTSLIMMLQAFIIPQLLLKHGMSTTDATAAYGNFSGVAMTLLHLPGIFTSTMSTALLPAIAEAINRPALLTDRINQSLQINSCIGMPTAYLLFFYAEDLCSALFHTPDAAPCLQALAVGAWFIYTQGIVTGIQHGLGTLKQLLLNLCIAGAIFLATLWVLIPEYGIMGAAIACIIFAAVNCCLAFFQFQIGFKIHIDYIHIVFKPLLATIAAIYINKTAASILTANLIPPTFWHYGQILVFAILYLLILFGLRGLPNILIRYFRR